MSKIKVSADSVSCRALFLVCIFWLCPCIAFSWCVCMDRDRERERERQRQRDRETERQRERQTERERERASCSSFSKGINSIMGPLPLLPQLNLITSKRPHLQISGLIYMKPINKEEEFPKSQLTLCGFVSYLFSYSSSPTASALTTCVPKCL